MLTAKEYADHICRQKLAKVIYPDRGFNSLGEKELHFVQMALDWVRDLVGVKGFRKHGLISILVEIMGLTEYQAGAFVEILVEEGICNIKILGKGEKKDEVLRRTGLFQGRTRNGFMLSARSCRRESRKSQRSWLLL